MLSIITIETITMGRCSLVVWIEEGSKSGGLSLRPAMAYGVTRKLRT